MIAEIVLAVLLFIILNVFISSYVGFCSACRRKRRAPNDERKHCGRSYSKEVAERLSAARLWMDAASSDPICIQARDGLRLCGRVIPAEGEAKGIILLFHGLHSSCRRDLAIQAEELHRAGYHLVLPWHRSHGASEGKYHTFGATERWDVERWCCFALERFGDLPIGLMGLSMGASTVLMSANTGLPPQVKCIAGDCGFTDPWEITVHVLKHHRGLPPYPTIQMMNFWARLLAGFDYRECSAIESLKESSYPVLLIHGGKDNYVPTDMSRRIAAAFPDRVDLLIVENAHHGRAIHEDTDRYLETMLTFFNRHMEK